MADLSNKPFLKIIRDILADGIKRIDNDECDETQAVGMIAKFNAETDSQISRERFVNYDKAMKIVGVKNRTDFKSLCDANKITQRTINNIKVGFLRSEIENLSTRLKNEKKGSGEMNLRHPTLKDEMKQNVCGLCYEP